MNTLESTLTAYLLALFRQWYALPAKATRVHVRAALTGLAGALPENAPPDAVQAFAGTIEQLPAVVAAVGATRQPLQVALQQGASLSAEQAARVRDLLQAQDPFALALGRMLWHPSALEPSLERLRALVEVESARLGDAQREQAAAIFAQYAAALPAARANHTATVELLKQTLAALEALPALRVLAWREFRAAKVTSADQFVSTLGVGWVKPVSVPPGDLGIAPVATSVALYSDIHFPKGVKRSTTTWEPLIVRLTTTPQATSAATTAVHVPFVDPAQPQQVDVLVTAPDFEERFQTWQRTIIVYSDRDSQPAVFLVRSNVVGAKRITVDFYHAGRQIGSTAFVTTVQETPAPANVTPIGEEFAVEGFDPAPPPPADLELRIVRAGSENRLEFTLHSSRPEVGFHWLRCGSVELIAANPFDFLEYKFKRLSELAAAPAGQTAEETARAQAHMTAIGEELWDEVIPEQFKTGVWNEIKRLHEQGIVRSLQITSDEPWIPWEMVKPYTLDEVTGVEGDEEPFWAARFEMARWLAGRGSASRVKVQAARIVAPSLDLQYVAQEKSAFDALAAQGIAIAPALQLRAQVQAVLQDGGIQLLHVASHGAFDAANASRSRLVLQDGDLTPDDLSPSATKGLRASRPLVFLNACSVGRLGYTLTGLGGWADKLVNTGRVGAFIGTLWAVNDRLAAAFAQHFYERLFAGDALGTAFHSARLAIRDLEPGNPTWLAYTLYGDPNAIFTTPTDG